MAATALGAIVARFDASPVGAQLAASGGLWVGSIPETKALPFVACVHEDEVPEWTMERNTYTEEVRYSFHVFAVGLANAEDIAGKVKTTFDLPNTTDAAAAFQIINAQTFSNQRTGYRVAYEAELEGSGDIVFHVTIPYTLWLAKTL